MSESKNNSQILGYGKKMKVLAGINDKGDENVIEYHFTPVALRNIPKLTEKINSFVTKADEQITNWGEDQIDNAAEIILMSIEKMHPKVTVEEIKDQFTLSGIANAISIVMDINDFLSEMGKLTERTNQVANPQQAKK